MDHSASHPVIFYDGECGFCQSSVQFVLKRDINQRFRYAALQSDYAKKYLPEDIFENPDFDTIYLLENSRLYDKSEAALRIIEGLPGPIRFMSAFRIIPKFLRDTVYMIISKNRKRLQKNDNCLIPTPETHKLFLD